MTRDNDDIHSTLDHLLRSLGETQSAEEIIKILNSIRSSSAGSHENVDHFFLTTILRLKQSINISKAQLKKLKDMLASLTAPPFHLACFIRFYDETTKTEAVVHHGNLRRIVSIDSRLKDHPLVPGDEVFLGSELNTLIKTSRSTGMRCGEIAHFEAYIPGDRLLLQHRDEKIIVDTAGALKNVELKRGDRVHFDRSVQMAYEKIESEKEHEYIPGTIPDVRREDVGGQDEYLDELFNLVAAPIEDPSVVSEYGLGGSACVLLCGPPGTGKTLIAKFLASAVFQLTGKKGRFAVVKPGEFESPWVGETQSNIRSLFKKLSEAAEKGPVILFMDEVEVVGRSRGGMSSHHADKFLAALLTELDGFVALGRVVVISASNRKDLIDPALLERLSADGEFFIHRPDIEGARSIFSIHLKATLPYRGNGSSAEETRQDMIETAVSRMYSPNSPENQICELRFRDGTTRTIEARELVSGRLIKQICTTARRAALSRKRQDGGAGLCVADIERALSKALGRLREGTLTPANAREHIHDLPQDLDVVSVEPHRPEGVSHEKRYMVLEVV